MKSTLRSVIQRTLNGIGRPLANWALLILIALGSLRIETFGIATLFIQDLRFVIRRTTIMKKVKPRNFVAKALHEQRQFASKRIPDKRAKLREKTSRGDANPEDVNVKR